MLKDTNNIYWIVGLTRVVSHNSPPLTYDIVKRKEQPFISKSRLNLERDTKKFVQITTKKTQEVCFLYKTTRHIWDMTDHVLSTSNNNQLIDLLIYYLLTLLSIRFSLTFVFQNILMSMYRTKQNWFFLYSKVNKRSGNYISVPEEKLIQFGSSQEIKERTYLVWLLRRKCQMSKP